MDAEEWRESVLSTRSLSYISHAGSLVSPMDRSGSVSHFRAPYHHGTTYSDLSEDEHLEMVVPKQEQAHLNDIHELPDSVAHSLLFELPREIRDRIYTLCLTATDGLPLEWPRPRDAPGTSGLQPQLLRACKIVHDESAPLMYTLNNFTFHHPSDANMFYHCFASSPMGRQITNLSLHIKAQDMRMWMGYLTSADESRSLKADYPNLKELGVRFRSNKWKHEIPPEANLKTWCEDNRLEELMDGLRHVFISRNSPERQQISEREFQAYLNRNPTMLPDEEDTPRFRKRLIELQKLRASHAAFSRLEAPTIRVCCACRVHTTHFNAITTPSAPRRDSGDPPVPIVEGEAFRGFTAVDLQHGVKRLIDPDLGSANVARTLYADKQGILLALEIYCLDPKRDAGERTS